jgi:hypothetical protein
MRILPHLSAVAAVAVLLTGCEAEPPARAPTPGQAGGHPQAAAPAEAEITKDVAVRTARTDAFTRFRDFGGISFIDAQPLGRFWVVELHASNGQGLRYAISKNDGTIRQRSMVR